MKKRVGIWTVVAALILCCIPCVTAANANSAMRYWYGTTGTDATVLDRDCPLVVEHEQLTFYADSFPALYPDEQAPTYNAHVTAEYTFYNPEDYDITAALAFPFGTAPSYLDWAEETDANRYAVTVDGRAVEKQLRHTYTDGTFQAQTDTDRLRDTYVEDSIYAPDVAVYVYRYTFSGIDPREDSAYASTTMPIQSDTRIATDDSNGVGMENDRLRVGKFVKNGATMTIYSIGRQIPIRLHWNVYENGSERKLIAGTATVQTETMTFFDLVMQNYQEHYGVSRVDWYNAAVAQCNRATYCGNYIGENYSVNPNGLMRWYAYTLHVPAQSRVVNAVTAPLYPSVNLEYSPAVYTYQYLLSPAGVWRSFGGLDIEIKTPFFMYGNYGYDFVPTEEGYSVTLEGLPDGELRFALCTVEDPQYTPHDPCRRFWSGCGRVMWAGVFVWLLLLVFSIAVFARRSDPHRKKKDGRP